MDDEVYGKLLVIYKDLKDFFTEEAFGHQQPACVEVLYRMLLKEMNRRKE